MIIAAFVTLAVLILVFLAICKAIPHIEIDDEEQMEYLEKWKKKKG